MIVLNPRIVTVALFGGVFLARHGHSFAIVGRSSFVVDSSARSLEKSSHASMILRPSVRAQSAMATSSTMATDETLPPLSGNCLVIGGNRGLGLEVVRYLKQRQANIMATTRSRSEDLEAEDVKVLEGIDVADGDSGSKLVDGVRKHVGDGGTLDYVFCIAGILIPDTFEEPKFDAAIKMYEALTMSGLLREGSKIGMVTSEGGSISLRTEVEGGNNYGHHMSKAAQNMMGKIFALDVKPRGIAIVCLHPGFMKTSMTEIYKDKYDELGAIDAKQAAPGIVQAVEKLTIETTGRFISPKGSQSLGLGVYALDNPDDYGPFSELPW